MAGELRDEQWHARNDGYIRAIADSSLVAIGQRRQTHPASGDSQSCNHASSLPHDLAPLALDALLEREVEHVLHARARLGRALDVLGPNLARNVGPLLGRHGRLALRGQHAARLVVPAQVGLGADEDERCAVAEVGDFGVPLDPSKNHTQPE